MAPTNLHGVGPGYRVAIAMRNRPEWPLTFWAVTAVGAIAVPLNSWWTGPELEFAVTDSQSVTVIGDLERHEWLRAGANAAYVVVPSPAANVPTGSARSRSEGTSHPNRWWSSLLTLTTRPH
jgi:acyl-CoA synthetase (AMP-forming)/AMP-acid ligase II